MKVRAWQGVGCVPESLEGPLWTIAMNLDGNFRCIYVFCPSESICSVRFWSSDLYLLVLTASSRAEFGFFNFETSAHFTPGWLWFAENNFLCFSDILREIWEKNFLLSIDQNFIDLDRILSFFPPFCHFVSGKRVESCGRHKRPCNSLGARSFTGVL